MDKPTQQIAQQTNRPPWWVVYVVALFTGFGVWVKSLVSDNRDDLKAQIIKEQERTDKLIIVLHRNNIMQADLLELIHGLNKNKSYEILTIDSAFNRLTGSGPNAGAKPTR